MRWAFMVVVIGCTSSLGGCHFYHPGRDELARQVQKDFTDLRLGKSMNEERTLSDNLLEAEIAAATEHGEAARDRNLAILLDSRVATAPAGPPATAGLPGSLQCPPFSLGQVGSLMCEIDRTLQRLVGDEPDEIAAAVDELELEKQVEATIALWRRAPLDPALRAAFPSLACTAENLEALQKLDVDSDPDFQGVAATHREQMKVLLFDYAAPIGDPSRAQGGACARLVAARAALTQAGGELAAVDAEVAAAKAKLAAAGNEAAKLQAAHAAALKVLKDASERPGPIETKLSAIEAARSAVEDALGELDAGATKAAETLTGTGLGNPVDIARLEARVTAATGALRTVLASAATTYEESGAAAVVDALLEREKIGRDAALPVLLLEAETLAGRLAHAKADVENGKALLAALEDQRAAVLRARAELAKARRRLLGPGGLVCNKALASRTVATVLATKGAPASADEDGVTQDERCRRGVAAAMLHYADAWTLGLIPARASRVRVIGLHERGALEASAASLSMWEHVLAVPIAQLVEFHAGGVKPEEAARLVIEALGFAGLIATTGAQAAK